jgi:hypothetical protein
MELKRGQIAFTEALRRIDHVRAAVPDDGERFA